MGKGEGGAPSSDKGRGEEKDGKVNRLSFLVLHLLTPFPFTPYPFPLLKLP